MAEPGDLCLAILAAGRSERFGPQDKLTALLHGKMLGLHIAETLAEFGFCKAYVIASSQEQACVPAWQTLGYDVRVNERAAEGLSGSVAKAGELALAASGEGLMICLADMPFVPASHCGALIGNFNSGIDTDIIASSDGKKSSPPAIFGSGHFESLMSLRGDSGARGLLKNARTVETESRYLVDFDRPETLENYQDRN